MTAARSALVRARRAAGWSQERLAHEVDVVLGAAPPSVPAPVDAAERDVFDRLARIVDEPRRVDVAAVQHLAGVLHQQRRVEDLVGPARVLPGVLATAELVETLAREARREHRASAVDLLGQFRQFCGWMAEDAGRHGEALGQYDRALEAATEVGDANMITSVWSLKSHLAWSRRDAGPAVGLAVAGQRERGSSPGVRALIVQQEARGRALLGEVREVERLLDETERLACEAAAHPDAEPPWVYFAGPERVLFQRGVALLELGRPERAIELFEQARALLPASFRRDRGRYTASLARAAARAGDVERAVMEGRAAVIAAVETGSATTAADLRAMRAALDRWAGDRRVVEFDVDVADLIR